MTVRVKGFQKGMANYLPKQLRALDNPDLAHDSPKAHKLAVELANAGPPAKMTVLLTQFIHKCTEFSSDDISHAKAATANGTGAVLDVLLANLDAPGDKYSNMVLVRRPRTETLAAVRIDCGSALHIKPNGQTAGVQQNKFSPTEESLLSNFKAIGAIIDCPKPKHGKISHKHVRIRFGVLVSCFGFGQGPL